ncbi:HpcH/HpaI aldolase/citrate lyase family protein [Kineococcus sp. LSe6-4]|uniref:HpcH/HpaI aldolase/citrate lyase family protein n=1 Tax=Kineococcus halophytocola TaxID=3234027 RepID=A0ABV4H0Q5_9ACTN
MSGVMDHPLRSAWTAGRPALGAWLLTADTLVAQTVAGLGFDYVGVDAQHGAATDASTQELVAALAPRTTPLVRVRQNDAGLIGRALDAGAFGVVVPLVESAEQAAAAVAACRYPPGGLRSFGPARARALHGGDYAQRADAAVCCIPMIETAAGLARVDEVLAVPGVDGVYVGPADLSLSLGLPALLDQDDARFDDALAAVVASARRHGVPAGVHASAALAGKRLAQGFTMVTVAVDQSVLTEGMRFALDRGRAG